MVRKGNKVQRTLTDEEIERLSKISLFEKIENGDWYQFGKAPELQEIVKKSSQSIQKINDKSKESFEEARELLEDFLPHLSKTAEIYFPLTSVEYPERFYVGEESFINSGIQVISAGKVTIGNHCFIGPNCQLFTPNHHASNPKLRRQGWQYDAPITIGNDCWLGGTVIILPGVSIGDDVVIGAGSVVTKDVPSHCMVAGNPARILKRY
ncbi:sugar O-acetyltransferase [Lactococcus allomyrinae]|uniref:Sugar O-acetyltransferase n=1 Tax=Lactococcus allomyrinae TaxID=2419773 RepID=A0A387BNP8_9LACT|nr:sugar O-acetyltransferase [Lactococcus allomyrinae]